MKELERTGIEEIKLLLMKNYYDYAKENYILIGIYNFSIKYPSETLSKIVKYHIKKTWYKDKQLDKLKVIEYNINIGYLFYIGRQVNISFMLVVMIKDLIIHLSSYITRK